MTTALGVRYQDLAKRVAGYLGYGRPSSWDDSDWDQGDLDDIRDIIDSGLRQFYYPPQVINPSTGRMHTHEWSFLNPVATLTTEADKADYTGTDDGLPSDLNRTIGNMTFSADTQYPAVQHVGEGYIRSKRAYQSLTDRPQYYSIRPVVMSGSGINAQTFMISFYPTPDAAYTLSFQYEIVPHAVRQSTPYAYGGTHHAETIIASCLAAAELMKNDDRGHHWQRFLELLSTSIEKDKSFSRITNLGYNHDNNTLLEEESRTSYVTYNGQMAEEY